MWLWLSLADKNENQGPSYRTDYTDQNGDYVCFIHDFLLKRASVPGP